MATPGEQASLKAASLFSCEGVIALVTGGGTGIGYMISNALLQNGAEKVFIAGRRQDVLTSAASRLGPGAIPLPCDVTSRESLQSAVSTVSSSASRLDLLVCNAGIIGPHARPPPEASLEEWAAAHLALGFDEYVKTFEINVAAAWYTTLAFLPLLGKGNEAGVVKQGSQVVVTSSIAAFNKTSPSGYAYGQSKAAVTFMVKQLSVLLPKWNIRVNAICPGLFPSDMAASVVKLDQSGESGEPVVPKEMIPLQRMGDNLDMGGAILYLVSRAGAYCNGNVLIVDGGRLGNFPSTT